MVEKAEDLTADLLLSVIERQAQQGVDYMTVHCGLLRHHLPLARKRLVGIVSREEWLLASRMAYDDRESPLGEHFGVAFVPSGGRDCTSIQRSRSSSMAALKMAMPSVITSTEGAKVKRRCFSPMAPNSVPGRTFSPRS